MCLVINSGCVSVFYCWFVLLCSVVEFKSKELVDKAIERMHKYKMGDRSIVVREVSGEKSCE